MIELELEFNGGTHYARLRKAVGLLLQRDDWRGHCYKFIELVDALNILCGYNEDDETMKKVDVEMVTEAFNLKGACASMEGLMFPNHQLTGQEADGGNGNSRRRSRGNNGGGGDAFVFHLYRHTLASDSKKREYMVGCVKEGDDEPGGIEGRDEGWSLPQVKSDIMLWDGMKSELQDFLKNRKKAADKNRKRERTRNGPRGSTPSDTAGRSTNTPTAKRTRSSVVSTTNITSATTEEEEESPAATATTEEDEEETPVRPLELNRSLEGADLRSLLFDDSNNVKESVAKCLLDGVKLKFDAKESLTPDERRLLGGLAQCEMKANEKNGSISSIKEIYSFERKRPFTLHREPQQYNKGTTSTSPRTLRYHQKIAGEWMQLIASGGFLLAFILDQITRLSDTAKRQINKATSYFWSEEDTISLMSYCNFHGEHMKRLRRFTRWKLGFGMFASEGSVRKKKQSYYQNECRTAKSTRVTMQRPVQQTKNGRNIMTRDSPVMVFTIRPLEHVVCMMADLFRSDKFKRRLGGPGELSTEHKDKAVVKCSGDAGGGSTKLNINSVNVKNPQGQEHQRVVGEFSGIKDTGPNVGKGFFGTGSEIKSDLEHILHRRCNVLKVTAERREELQTIVMVNSDDDHDESKPRPLPAYANEVTTESIETNDDNKLGIGLLPFSSVAAYRVLEKDGDFVGMSFFDSDNKCICTVMFREPLEKVAANKISVEQYMVIGALSADMEFLSTFIGHQGASAKYPCIYNLATNADVKEMWDHTDGLPSYPPRTDANVDEHYALYVENYEDVTPENKTNKLRTNVTQNTSYSISMPKHLSMPFDCMIPSPMHVRLGGSRSLLDFDFDFFGKIAKLSSNGMHDESKEAIENEITVLQAYLGVIDALQEDVLKSLEAKDKVLDDMLDTMEKYKNVVDAGSLAESTRETYREKLEDLKQVYHDLTQGDADETEDQKTAKLHLLQQSCLVQNTINTLQDMYKKHSCFSRTIIVDVLKENGVDIQVYFNGTLIGPHCMILAQKSEKIHREILKRMKNKVKDQRLVDAMTKYTNKIIEINAVWYELCKTMMSTKYQDDEAIEKFESNIIELRALIVELVKTDPPLTGDENPLKLPSKLKWFTLLSDVMLKALKLWRCIGDIDEESIESFHPRRNKVSRRYCQTRGPKRNELIMKELQFESVSWIHEAIQEMLDATKAKRAPVVRRREQEEELDEEIEDIDGTEQEEDENVPMTEELMDYETEMNANEVLRIPSDFTHEDESLCALLRNMNNNICACHCGERFIGNVSLRIHQNQRHSDVSEELDAVDGNVR